MNTIEREIQAESVGVTVHEPNARQMPVIQADAQGNITPMQMILQAVQSGITPEALEKLTAMAERAEDRQAARLYHEAMAAFQSEVPMIAKSKAADVTTRDGGGVSYKFAPLEEIVRTIAPLVKKYGFTYSWDQDVLANGMSKTTIRIRHIAGHQESSSFTVPTENKSPLMSAQQKMAGADQYAKRKTLIAGFGLTTAEEDFIERTGALIDPTPIDEDQAIELHEMIVESKAPVTRLFKHFKITTIAELPAKRYQEAKLMIQQVAAARREKDGGQ